MKLIPENVGKLTAGQMVKFSEKESDLTEIGTIMKITQKEITCMRPDDESEFVFQVNTMTSNVEVEIVGERITTTTLYLLANRQKHFE